MPKISVIITNINASKVKIDFIKSPDPAELPMPPERWLKI